MKKYSLYKSYIDKINTYINSEDFRLDNKYVSINELEYIYNKRIVDAFNFKYLIENLNNELTSLCYRLNYSLQQFTMPVHISRIETLVTYDSVYLYIYSNTGSGRDVTLKKDRLSNNYVCEGQYYIKNYNEDTFNLKNDRSFISTFSKYHFKSILDKMIELEYAYDNTRNKNSVNIDKSKVRELRDLKIYDSISLKFDIDGFNILFYSIFGKLKHEIYIDNKIEDYSIPLFANSIKYYLKKYEECLSNKISIPIDKLPDGLKTLLNSEYENRNKNNNMSLIKKI